MTVTEIQAAVTTLAQQGKRPAQGNFCLKGLVPMPEETRTPLIPLDLMEDAPHQESRSDDAPQVSGVSEAKPHAWISPLW